MVCYRRVGRGVAGASAWPEEAQRMAGRSGVAMGHYKSNLRDIEFNLFEVLRRQDVLGAEPYPDLDEETARGILDEVNRLATGPLAESFAEGDRNPPVFDPATSSVRMPAGFKKSFAAFM